MFYKFFCFMFFVLFTLATPFVYDAHAHDEWPARDDLGGSVYAGAHGNVLASARFNETNFHVHCIGFAHFDRGGNYTVSSKVSEANGGKWGRENHKDDDLKEGTFTDGCYEVTIVAFEVPQWLDLTFVGWSGSATVEDTTTGRTKRAFVPENDNWRNNGGGDQKDEHGNDEDIDDADNYQDANNNLGITFDDTDNNQDANNLGITLANSDQTFEPGDSVTLDIVTADPFYTVSWYVHTPWDTSSSGTYQYDNYGDGTSTSGSFYYTIPTSGTTEVSGDFLFRALIYRWSDMFYVGTETYTVTVQ